MVTFSASTQGSSGKMCAEPLLLMCSYAPVLALTALNHLFFFSCDHRLSPSPSHFPSATAKDAPLGPLHCLLREASRTWRPSTATQSRLLDPLAPPLSSPHHQRHQDARRGSTTLTQREAKNSSSQSVAFHHDDVNFDIHISQRTFTTHTTTNGRNHLSPHALEPHAIMSNYESGYDPYTPAGGAGASSSGGVTSGNNKTAHIQAQIDETVGVMRDNIQKVNERGENLSDLQGKTGWYHRCIS